MSPKPCKSVTWHAALALAMVSASAASEVADHAQAKTAGVEATTVATAAPAGVAYDASGNLYVALQHDHVVVMVDGKGLIKTVAGTGEQGFAGDGGAATAALLDSPTGVAIDGVGNLYIADTHNHRVREVANGSITTIAGTGAAGFSGDGGAASLAQLDRPTALSVDATGNLYIADSGNHRIRIITNGMIATVAGDGEQAFSGDGDAAILAGLDTPSGVTADPTAPGRFYISDTHNERIRVVDASGEITTLAGTGVRGFGGDGGAPGASVVNRPRGIVVATSGTVYLVDSDNHRIRAITASSISTLAGTGEQGFSGDSGASGAALLDTPTAVAVEPGGLVAFSDTHNQRTRTIQANAINTVTGIPPAQTEGILLNGAIADIYGTGLLSATFSNGSNPATGMATLLDGGVIVATVPFTSNQANFNLSNVDAGQHSFVVAYNGDVQNAATASGVFVVTLLQATESIDFPQPATPVIFVPGASATLNATATSGVPITYTVTGPATVSGSTLTFTGGGTVVVTAEAESENYVPVSVSRTVVVNALSLAGLSPTSAALGTPALALTVTGSAFAENAMVLLNGTSVATSFVDSTTLTATIPASYFTSVQTLQVSVFDPTQNEGSGSFPFNVTAPPVQVAVAAPPISNPGTQPEVALTLAAPYPVQVSATLTLSFVPGPGGVDDPMIKFTNGKRTITMDIAAGQTTVPPAQFQAGTVNGVIAIALTVSAGGTDVTPPGLSPTLVVVPLTAPNLGVVSLARDGKMLTVVVSGYSDTRQVTQARFHFTPAAGAQIANQDVTIDITDAFAAWYSQADSDMYGSGFKYTQNFRLDDDASVVSAVTVKLTNSAGDSDLASTP